APTYRYPALTPPGLDRMNSDTPMRFQIARDESEGRARSEASRESFLYCGSCLRRQGALWFYHPATGKRFPSRSRQSHDGSWASAPEPRPVGNALGRRLQSKARRLHRHALEDGFPMDSSHPLIERSFVCPSVNAVG